MNWERGKYVGTPPTSNLTFLKIYSRPIWTHKHRNRTTFTNIRRMGANQSTKLNNCIEIMHITSTKLELVTVIASWGEFVLRIVNGMI